MTDRLVYALLAGTVGLIRRLPLGVCFLLGQCLGVLLWALAPGYRRLVNRNLSVLGGQNSPWMAVRHFSTLGANAVCAFKVPALSQATIRHIAPIEGLDHLHNQMAAGRGVVLAINHIGNWELYAQLVFQVPEARFGTVYQALRNPLVDELINRDRRRLGVLTFDRKKGFHGALALINEPGILGVLVDQNAGDGGLWTPFFGRLSSTSTLAATLALRAGAAIHPVAITTSGFARWKVVVSPEIAAPTVESLTFKINQSLEEQIRSSPPDWFWVHNRWKMPWPNFLTARQKRGHFVPDGAELRPFRIVVRSPNWLGDAVMSIPAARAFKLGRPDARLAILCPAKLVELWETVPEVDDVIPMGDSIAKVAASLRGHFDVAVLFPNSFRSALEAWLAGIPRRVGYGGHARKFLLNQVIQPPKKKGNVPRPLHHADRYWHIAGRCGAVPPPDPVAQWQAPGERIFGVCPGAEFGPAKRWQGFRKVMELVSAATPCKWILFGSPGDAAIGDDLANGFQGTVENRIGKTSLRELIDGLCGVSALVSNDTGTMHLADALGVPLVAIFGSTEPALTGPRSPRSRILRHQVECSPCYLRKCPLDFRCMNAVTPDEVASELLALSHGLPA